MPAIHPNEDVKKGIIYTSLGFKVEIQAGDINLELSEYESS